MNVLFTNDTHNLFSFAALFTSIDVTVFVYNEFIYNIYMITVPNVTLLIVTESYVMLLEMHMKFDCILNILDLKYDANVFQN